MTNKEIDLLPGEVLEVKIAGQPSIVIKHRPATLETKREDGTWHKRPTLLTTVSADGYNVHNQYHDV